MDKQDTEEPAARTWSTIQPEFARVRAGMIVLLVLYAAVAVFSVLAVLALQPLAVYLLWIDDYPDSEFVSERGLTILLIATPALYSVVPGAVALLLGLKAAFSNLLRSKAPDAPIMARRYGVIVGIFLIYIIVSFASINLNLVFGSAYSGITVVAALTNIGFAQINRSARWHSLMGGLLLTLIMAVGIFVVGWFLLVLLDSSVAAYLSAFGIAGAVLIVVSAVAGGFWLRASREYLVAVAVLIAAACAAAAAIVLGLDTRADFAESSMGSFFFTDFIWVIAAVLLLQQLAFLLLPFLLRASVRYARLRHERDAAREG